MKPLLHDMHCHLDFMTNGQDVAADALSAGTLLFANTVTPEEWLAARERYRAFPNVVVGFGLHPWWVGENPSDKAEDGPEPLQRGLQGEQAGQQQQPGRRVGQQEQPNPRAGQQQQRSQLVEQRQAQQTSQQNQQAGQQRQLSQRAEHRRQTQQALAQETDSEQAVAQREHVLELLDCHNPRVIGEIGLDLSWRHVHARAEQLRMFEAIANWAAKGEGKLLSLHSVKAAQETFDVLGRTGALQACTCVFHWFTGPSDLLHRAIKSGCYFSCGPRMLATGKGREYVKAIPVDRLLLETDAPPAQDMLYSYAELHAELESVANSIAAIKGEDALELIAETSAQLLC